MLRGEKVGFDLIEISRLATGFSQGTLVADSHDEEYHSSNFNMRERFLLDDLLRAQLFRAGNL